MQLSLLLPVPIASYVSARAFAGVNCCSSSYLPIPPASTRKSEFSRFHLRSAAFSFFVEELSPGASLSLEFKMHAFHQVLEMELLVTDGLHIGGHIHPGPERCVVEITGPAFFPLIFYYKRSRSWHESRLHSNRTGGRSCCLVKDVDLVLLDCKERVTQFHLGSNRIGLSPPLMPNHRVKSISRE